MMYNEFMEITGIEVSFKYYDTVIEPEYMNENPIMLLGKYTLRAKQDICFNRTMIDALLAYIIEKSIKWDEIKCRGV